MPALYRPARARRRLAAALEHVVEVSGERDGSAITAGVPPARRAVHAAAPRLRECADVLRGGETPPAAFVGAVQGLLEDGNGPLYVEERDLELALDALDALRDC